MSIKYKIILLSLFVTVSAGANSIDYSKTKIHWLDVDYPPAYFVNGPMKGLGFSQIAKQQFINALPQFEHVTLNVNNKRLVKYMSTKNAVYCVAQAGVSLKEISNIRYSHLVTVVSPVGIVVRGPEEKVFREQYQNSFEKLIKNNALKVGMIAKGFYGEEVSKIINKNPKAAGIFMRHSSTNPNALYKFLLSKRIDYFLDYGFSYHYQVKQYADKTFKFAVIKEQQAPRPVYAICNESRYSDDVIDTINKVIKKTANKERIRMGN